MPDRLAASAFALFSRHGIQNVTLDQVATHAGVTKGSLYWHYESKDELIKAACAHYYRAYHRRIHAALARITDPVQRLARTLEVATRICLVDHPNRVFTTEVFTLALSDEELRRSWRQFFDSVREFYLGLVRAAAATGRLKNPNPEAAVDYLLSAMEGIKLRALYDPQLCSAASEQDVVANLKRMVGLNP
jgi:AcrR family transcriptional regulator